MLYLMAKKLCITSRYKICVALYAVGIILISVSDFAGNPRVVADQIDVGAYQSSAY